LDLTTVIGVRNFGELSLSWVDAATPAGGSDSGPGTCTRVFTQLEQWDMVNAGNLCASERHTRAHPPAFGHFWSRGSIVPVPVPYSSTDTVESSHGINRKKNHSPRSSLSAFLSRVPPPRSNLIQSSSNAATDLAYLLRQFAPSTIFQPVSNSGKGEYRHGTSILHTGTSTERVRIVFNKAKAKNRVTNRGYLR